MQTCWQNSAPLRRTKRRVHTQLDTLLLGRLGHGIPCLYINASLYTKKVEPHARKHGCVTERATQSQTLTRSIYLRNVPLFPIGSDELAVGRFVSYFNRFPTSSRGKGENGHARAIYPLTLFSACRLRRVLEHDWSIRIVPLKICTLRTNLPDAIHKIMPKSRKNLMTSCSFRNIS